MSSEKISCARCHAYLFEGEDDIVTCPICGAPHHRDCYTALGHCALEEFHGTERQYDKMKEAEQIAPPNEHAGEKAEGLITCGMCHEKYEFTRNRCPNCGASNIAKAGGSFASFDFLGGVPEDYDIGEGVTAEEAKRFVAVNTRRYIPKFATLNKANKASWNWAAFFFPCGWMLARKMFKNGAIVGILAVIATLFYIPLLHATASLGLSETASYTQMIQAFSDNLSLFSPLIFIFALLGFALNITIRVFSAILGDHIYKEHTIAVIKTIRAESQDMEYDYQRLGGINIFLFLLGVMAVQYIPSIIAVFM